MHGMTLVLTVSQIIGQLARVFWEIVHRPPGKKNGRAPISPMREFYCSRDIYLQLERFVITLVIIHSAQKKFIRWLL